MLHNYQKCMRYHQGAIRWPENTLSAIQKLNKPPVKTWGIIRKIAINASKTRLQLPRTPHGIILPSLKRRRLQLGSSEFLKILFIKALLDARQQSDIK